MKSEMTVEDLMKDKSLSVKECPHSYCIMIDSKSPITLRAKTRFGITNLNKLLNKHNKTSIALQNDYCPFCGVYLKSTIDKETKDVTTIQ